MLLQPGVAWFPFPCFLSFQCIYKNNYFSGNCHYLCDGPPELALTTANNDKNCLILSLIVVFLLSIIRCSGGRETPPVLPIEEDTTTADIVEIDSISFKGLKFYYPPIASIGLSVGKEPDTSNFYISFCCAAAYTDKSIYQHQGPANHIDVAGDHIDGGELHRGYTTENNTGGFIVYPYPDFHWEIVNSMDYRQRISAETKPCTAFQQELLILHGAIQQFIRTDRPEFYRALCNYNGRLCIVDGTHKHLLSSFVDLLYNAGIEDALYLDMGNWSYSWYREYPEQYNIECSFAKLIHPKPPKGGYHGSNWLAFYVVN